MKSVLLRRTSSFINRSKLKGQYTDVKSGYGTSVGPSLNPQSQLKQNSRDTVHFKITLQKNSSLLILGLKVYL